MESSFIPKLMKESIIINITKILWLLYIFIIINIIVCWLYLKNIIISLTNNFKKLDMLFISTVSNATFDYYRKNGFAERFKILAGYKSEK